MHPSSLTEPVENFISSQCSTPWDTSQSLSSRNRKKLKFHQVWTQHSTSSSGGVNKPDKDLMKQMLLSTRLLSAENQIFDIEFYETTPFVIKALAFLNPDDSFTVLVLNT